MLAHRVAAAAIVVAGFLFGVVPRGAVAATPPAPACAIDRSVYIDAYQKVPYGHFPVSLAASSPPFNYWLGPDSGPIKGTVSMTTTDSTTGQVLSNIDLPSVGAGFVVDEDEIEVATLIAASSHRGLDLAVTYETTEPANLDDPDVLAPGVSCDQTATKHIDTYPGLSPRITTTVASSDSPNTTAVGLKISPPKEGCF